MYPQTTYPPRLDGRPDGGGRPEHKAHITQFPGVLDVVAVVSNPRRYRARYDLYRVFERMVTEAGARLTTVEVAFGGRPFEVTRAGNPRHVQLRSSHELWHKENLINLGIQRLPEDWQYAAWIDADVEFARHDWVQETLQQLQHHAIVQLFSHAIDLGPRDEPLDPYVGAGKVIASWCHCYGKGLPHKASFRPRDGAVDPYGYDQGPGTVPGYYWHPGYAWAARREAIEALGGLVDWAVLGGADYHMAAALIGKVENTLRAGLAPAYRAAFFDWQDRAERHVRRNIGCVDGLVLHRWHGPKKSRRYVNRWDVLVDHKFDHVRDLKRDWQGLWQLVDHDDERSISLRDWVRKYFAQRDEDSTAPADNAW